MKLLVATGIYPPDAGGPATYSKLMAGELQRKGHQVAILTYANDIKKTTDDKWRVTRIKRSLFKPLHYWLYWRAARRLGRNVDLIYVQDTVTAGYPTLLAARELKKPFAVKVTGDYSWEQAYRRGETKLLIDAFQKEQKFSRRIKTVRHMQTEVCRSANLVITPAKYLKRLAMGWGVEEDKIKVIYNAVGEIGEIDRNDARKKLGLNDSDFFVVSVGRDVPWKGFIALRKVVEELQKKFPLKLKILNKASRSEVLQTLKAADVFVLNTGYEGFPHVVLEAMALGTPVITTNVCGNPELIINERNGLLVEFNNLEQLSQAIRRVANSSELRTALARQAIMDVGRFSIDAMVRHTEETLLPCVS